MEFQILYAILVLSFGAFTWMFLSMFINGIRQRRSPEEARTSSALFAIIIPFLLFGVCLVGFIAVVS